MPDRYVFDAFALNALRLDEPGAAQVQNILDDLSSEVYMSAINLGELLDTLRRRRGQEAAQTMESAAFQQPNLTVVEASWARIRAAAEIKADGGLSYADAFAAALAREMSAPLVTGDPELERLEQRGLIQVVWLPRR